MTELLNQFGGSGILIAAAGLAFVVVAVGVVAGVMILMNPTRTAKDRLEDLTGGPKDAQKDAVAEAIAERLGQFAQPKDAEQRDLLKLRLMQAGYRDKRAVEFFNGIRVALALILPIVASPILVTMAWHWILIGVIISAGVGYMIPMLVVNNNLQRRQRNLLAPFPDALDLLVTSVEAGLGVDAAFRRVADELEAAAPELAQEFQLVNHEISAGVTRIEALRHLADRTGLDEVKSLTNMLTQAERFGTSIARSLRVHSDLTRQKRMARAEEEAAKVSPKLTVIMIIFLLPCLAVVLLGPAIIRVKNTFAAR